MEKQIFKTIDKEFINKYHLDHELLDKRIVIKYNDNILVIVRVSERKDLKVCSMYPIKNEKYNRLKNSINS